MSYYTFPVAANGNSSVDVSDSANVVIKSSGNTVFTVTPTSAEVTGNLVASNIGSTGAMAANGNVAFTGANVSLGAVGNLYIEGGSNLQFLQTDGNGNVTWAIPTVDTIVNGNTFFTIADSNGNITGNVTGSAAFKLSPSSLAIGKSAGSSAQGANSIAIGQSAGNISQGSQSVAIGISAARDTQGANAVAIGTYAGQYAQSANAVGIGYNAGSSSQGVGAVAIGVGTGSYQGANAVAVGANAGQNNQGAYSVSIGFNAGSDNAGANSIYIGANAGPYGFTRANVIVLNSSGADLTPAIANAFYVSTARFDQTSANTANNYILTYDSNTKEIRQGTPVFTYAQERVTLNGAAGTGTVAFDVLSNAIQYTTATATANVTVNFRGNAGVTLNSMLPVGQSVTCTYIMTTGGTGYAATAVQIDGTAQTVRWLGGTAPTANTNSTMSHTFTLIKTAASTYTVLGAQTRYA